ncbi:hypothetical protein HNR46_001587 [Haloferula luteola]|uniref:Uncharacterized protein n=1 Tax=Haloferula luteola TaxID=595692 RepID=A0A840VEV6_9BACT|nr:hypothetical protein [Haloferula luteola]MBB5351351.1 hypothetical protein [Haloferula luteola]
MDTYSEGPYKSFQEETLGDLVDKEGFLVMLGNADNTVKLATSGDAAIGVLHQRTSMESREVAVRLLGKGGTVKVKAGGVIAKDARVIWGAGAKVITQPAVAGSYRTFGRKTAMGNSAEDDVVEIIDVIEPVIVP